jgi:hypothetical protein
MQRIDPANWSGQSPMIDPPSIQYELADRIQAISAGGLGVSQQMVKQLDLADSFNRQCSTRAPRLVKTISTLLVLTVISRAAASEVRATGPEGSTDVTSGAGAGAGTGAGVVPGAVAARDVVSGGGGGGTK